MNLIRLPHLPARSGALGWLDVACRVVIDVFPDNSIDECPVDHRVDVAHRFGRQTTCHLLWNNAGLVPSNRCSRCVDRRLARIGNLTSRGGFALRDSIRPVGVYLAVAVALDPSFCEQLPRRASRVGVRRAFEGVRRRSGGSRTCRYSLSSSATLWHRSMVRWPRTIRRRIGRRCGWTVSRRGRDRPLPSLRGRLAMPLSWCGSRPW